MKNVKSILHLLNNLFKFFAISLEEYDSGSSKRKRIAFKVRSVLKLLSIPVLVYSLHFNFIYIKDFYIEIRKRRQERGDYNYIVMMEFMGLLTNFSNTFSFFIVTYTLPLINFKLTEHLLLTDADSKKLKKRCIFWLALLLFCLTANTLGGSTGKTVLIICNNFREISDAPAGIFAIWHTTSVLLRILMVVILNQQLLIPSLFCLFLYYVANVIDIRLDAIQTRLKRIKSANGYVFQTEMAIKEFRQLQKLAAMVNGPFSPVMFLTSLAHVIVFSAMVTVLSVANVKDILWFWFGTSFSYVVFFYFIAFVVVAIRVNLKQSQLGRWLLQQSLLHKQVSITLAPKHLNQLINVVHACNFDEPMFTIVGMEEIDGLLLFSLFQKVYDLSVAMTAAPAYAV